MVTGDQVVAAARRYLGVSYRHQGHSPQGLDCWGLVRLVLEEFSLLPAQFEAPERYGSRPDRIVVDNVRGFCTKIASPRQGCLVLITWPRQPYPTHLGIYGDGNLIHAFQAAERVVEHGYRAPWTRMTSGLFIVPGVENV